MFRRMWLSVSLAVLGHACGGSAPSATEVSREGTAQCPTIREVDWLNRSYDFGFAGVQRVTNGRHVQGEGEEGMEIHSSAQGPLYGDLTGDGVDEAVMALDTFDGGNDPPRWLEVYTVRDCEVVRLGVVPASLEGDEYNSLIGEGIEGGRLVVATGNKGKLAEIGEVLADADVTLIAQGELGVSDADETGTTFVENAIATNPVSFMSGQGIRLG